LGYGKIQTQDKEAAVPEYVRISCITSVMIFSGLFSIYCNVKSGSTSLICFTRSYLGAVAGNVAVLGAGGYMLARKGNIPIQRYGLKTKLSCACVY
jgi:hypothetical protein